MVKKLFTEIWHLIKLFITSWIKYTFRIKNVFRLPLILVTTQLLLELGELGRIDYLEPLYKFISNEYGEFKGIIVEVIGDFITGNYFPGFSYFSIAIKLLLIMLFSFLAYSKDNGINISWNWFWGWTWKWDWSFLSGNKIALINKESEFTITKPWFDDINKTYRLNKNKFIKELHVESKLEKKLFDQIVNHRKKITDYEESFKKCRSAALKLKSEINELNILSENTKSLLILNKKSNKFFHYQNIVESTSIIDEQLNLISVLSDIRSNQQVAIKEVYFPISSSELNNYIKSYSFDLLKVKTRLSTSDKVSIRKRIFNAFSPILISIRNLNESIIDLNSKKEDILKNHFIVHATAGVGKTYFAAHIYNSLKKYEQLPLFIPASAFSGNHSSLSHAFQKVFKYPEAISINSFFLKLNEFAKKKKKRVILIIDGLNETTYNLSGFSPIWGDGIENLTEDISKYEYLTFLATCRTSYLENSMDRAFSLDCSHELSGFESFDIRNKAIKQYFKHYKIESNVINSNNSRLFSTPLILRIYCIGENGDRAGTVKVKLNHNSYEKTLFKFIEEECIDLAHKLDRPSTRPIFNGIFRSSEKFIQEISGSLNYDIFLELMQGKSIDEIRKSTSIGYKFLESELLFMKDFQPYFKGEKVVHTFQNVGGYLLAQFLYEKYNKPSDFVKSDEFYKLFSGIKKNRIDGSLNNNTHQLGLDIMLFIVYQYSKSNDPKYTDDLLDYTQDPLVLDYSWRFVSDYWGFGASKRLLQKLKELSDNINIWDGILGVNIDEYLDPNLPLNFIYIKDYLLEIPSPLVELSWVKNIYERSKIFQDFLKIEYSDYDVNQRQVALELTIWLLESTSHNLRDEANKKLLEYTIQNPKFIFDKIYEYSTVGRPYIYERLASICYGVCLRKQNDVEFMNVLFSDQIQHIYKLQFGNNPTAPTYNYIVIDSIKHMVDLAIYKGVFELDEELSEQLKNYKFNPNAEWPEITEEDENYVRGIVGSWHNSAKSDPFKGDFVHYTIPRLQKRGTEGPNNRLIATANIYKRLIELGYITEDKFKIVDKDENKFYHGAKPYGIEGKVDRLGKKYSWMAFFDYAGYLLNQGLLNVWYENDGDVKEYNRLSDVDIEVSNPTPIIYDAKLFNVDLLEFKNNDPKWTERPFYEESKQLWQQDFEEGNFTLVKGYLEQRPNKSYDIRTFLLIESFLVNKDEIEGNEQNIINQEFGWDYDIHSNSSFNHVYFGELYWADNIPEEVGSREAIATLNEQGEIVRRIYTTESTNSEYMWESDSNIFKTLRGNIPSPNLGKYLKLKADAENLQILDKVGALAFKTYEFEETDLIKQELDYLRTDLLKKYMEDKGLILMYQIKQHTYDRITGDGTGDFRGMQFFFPHLNE